MIRNQHLWYGYCAACWAATAQGEVLHSANSTVVSKHNTDTVDACAPRMRALVADGLGAIISREGDVLTRQCHATVRLLYPQVRAISRESRSLR